MVVSETRECTAFFVDPKGNAVVDEHDSKHGAIQRSVIGAVSTTGDSHARRTEDIITPPLAPAPENTHNDFDGSTAPSAMMKFVPVAYNTSVGPHVCRG